VLRNKHAKQLKKIQDIAEHLGSKLGIIKKERMPEDMSCRKNIDNVRSLIGQALNDLVEWLAQASKVGSSQCCWNM